MSKTSKHVVPKSGGGWSVKNSGASRASKVFDTQAKAVEYGKLAAKKEHSELYIHRKDGTIQDKKSFGSSRSIPKGKK